MGRFSSLNGYRKILHGACLVAMMGMLLAPAASAQELVLHQFIGRALNERFEDFLYLAGGVALTQLGLSSIRDSDSADMVLVTRYSIDGSIAELSYSLSRMSDPENELAGISVTVPVNLSMDVAIAGAIGNLLQAAGIAPGQSQDAKIYGLLAEPQAMPAAGPGSIHDAEASAAAQAEPTVAVLAVTRPPVPGPEAAGDAALIQPAEPPPIQKDPEAVLLAQLRPSPAFFASASTAGVMFVGEAMDYLRYGAGGGLGFGLSWKRPSRSLSLEGNASFSRAFNNSGVVGGPLYLSTAGLGFGIGTGTDKPYNAGASVTAGAAFLSIDGNSGFVTKTVPYFELGTSIGIPLGGSLSLGFGLRFMAAIDRELAVMGVSPTVTVRMER